MLQTAFVALISALMINPVLAAEPDNTDTDVVYKVFYTITYADPILGGQFMGSGSTDNLIYRGNMNIEFGKPVISHELHPYQLTLLFEKLPDDRFSVEVWSQKIPKYPDTFVDLVQGKAGRTDQ